MAVFLNCEAKRTVEIPISLPGVGHELVGRKRVKAEEPGTPESLNVQCQFNYFQIVCFFRLYKICVLNDYSENAEKCKLIHTHKFINPPSGSKHSIFLSIFFF